jgi:hypothetical protein
LTEKEREKLTVFLHKGAAGEWDFDTLANEFELDDLLDWGFEPKELDLDLWAKDEPPDDPGAQIDKAEELREKWGVESGQVWQLGEHRLVCGDCTDADVVARVMQGEKAQLTLTDPPYGLGEKKKSGKNDYNEYDDTLDNLRKLAGAWLPLAREISPVVVFFPGVTNAWLYPQADWVMCWFYAGGQLRSPWGFNCWQPLLCYGKDPMLQAGMGRHPDAIVHSERASSDEHPCAKPISFWCWLLERVTLQGETILEPFGGSGTTIIAAAKTGRVCRAMEISPRYCDVVRRRWTKFAKENNVEPGTGALE